MSEPLNVTLDGALGAEISNEVVRVLRAQTGRGPTQAKTMVNGDLIICLLHDTLTVGERTLVESGHAETVRDTRRLYQQVMRAELVSAIEVLTGRRVIAFLSDNHIDPDVAIEAFVLEARDAFPENAAMTTATIPPARPVRPPRLQAHP